MTFEEIKIAMILLEKLKKLKEEGEAFNKESVQNPHLEITPLASMILNQLEPYVAELDIARINLSDLNKIIYNLEEFLSIFEKFKKEETPASVPSNKIRISKTRRCKRYICGSF